MKTNFSFLVFLLITQFVFAQRDSLEVPKVELKTEIDTISYNLGVAVAASFPIDLFPEFNVNALAKGFAEGRDPSLKLDAQAANNVIKEYMQKIYEKEQERTKAERELEEAKLAEDNKTRYAENYKEQKDFIAVTKAKEGVITTPTGLMYEVITEGTGASPTENDNVKVHYKGTFIDGEEFDSSYGRGVPSTFSLRGVIKGWTEGIPLMTVGSKYKFYIPSDLGYGDAGGRMEPFKLMIFEIELFAINPTE